MAALCENVETVIIAALEANTAFDTAGLTAYHFERDADAPGERVVVKAVNNDASISAPSGRDVVAWNVEVMIEIRATTAEKCLEVLEAVEEALSTPTSPAVEAAAALLFPNGIEVLNPTALERDQLELHITRRFYPVLVLA